MKRKIHKWRAPYGWSYFHWTGLRFTSHHRRIIQSLERQRLTQGSVRIYIADPEPHKSGIPDLLTDYLAWLSTRINPSAQTILLDRTIRQARNHARLIPRAHALPSFNPTHSRGHAAQQLLLLNADLYGHDWSADITGHLRRHLFPSIPDAPGSLIIIHGNIDPTRNPQFAYEFIRALRGHFGPHWQTSHPQKQPTHQPQTAPKSLYPSYPNLPTFANKPNYSNSSNCPKSTTRPQSLPLYHLSIPLHPAAAAAA